MRKDTNQRLLLAFLCAALLPIAWTRGSGSNHGRRRTVAIDTSFGSNETRLETRHHSPPVDRDAEERWPQYAESALMISPCHPEIDGYFGSTSGSPIQFDFVFEMETTESSNIPMALTVIYEKVIDDVLSQTFPSVCAPGGSRHLQGNSNIISKRIKSNDEGSFSEASSMEADGGSNTEDTSDSKRTSTVTGFKFTKPQMDLNGFCKVYLNPSNQCGYYYGKIAVFGRNLASDDTVIRIMSMVLETVAETHKALEQYEIKRLVPSVKRSNVLGVGHVDYGGDGVVENGSGVHLTGSTKAGLIMALLIIIIGTTCLVIWVHNDFQYYKKVQTKEAAIYQEREYYSILKYFSSYRANRSDEATQSSMDAIYLQEFENSRPPTVEDFAAVDDMTVKCSGRTTDFQLDSRASYS